MKSYYDDSNDPVCVGRCDNPIVTCDNCGDVEEARSKKGLFIHTRDGEDLCSPCYDSAYENPEPPTTWRGREWF